MTIENIVRGTDVLVKAGVRSETSLGGDGVVFPKDRPGKVLLINGNYATVDVPGYFRLLVYRVENLERVG